MLQARQLLEFAGLAALVIAAPGPSVLFTVSRALTAGRRVALLNVVGNTAGVTAQLALAAFGGGALVERSAQVFTAVELLGAAYLVVLGVRAVRRRHSVAEALAAGAAVPGERRALLDGAVVGITNPKTIAFFLVVLPSFAGGAGGGLPLRMLAVGWVFPVIAVAFDSVWALAAGSAAAWLARSPRRLAALGGAGGLVMIGLGVSLVATGRKA